MCGGRAFDGRLSIQSMACVAMAGEGRRWLCARALPNDRRTRLEVDNALQDVKPRAHVAPPNATRHVLLEERFKEAPCMAEQVATTTCSGSVLRHAKPARDPRSLPLQATPIPGVGRGIPMASAVVSIGALSCWHVSYECAHAAPDERRSMREI